MCREKKGRSLVLRVWLRGTTVLLVALAIQQAAHANLTVTAGFDLLATPPVGSSSMDFTVAPIPGDFFGPGSDPFEGTVALKGEPLPAGPGTTDTIINRKTDALLPGPGGSATIPIEIIALSLVSVNPITVTYGGGQNPEPWDVWVSPFQTNTGQMTIRQDSPAGGTFTSTLPVTPRFVFVRQSDLETLPMIATDFLHVTDTSWSYAAPAGVWPSANNFFPGGVPGNPNALNHVFFDGYQLDLDLVLTPLPEPGSFGLLALGGLGMLRRRQPTVYPRFPSRERPERNGHHVR